MMLQRSSTAGGRDDQRSSDVNKNAPAAVFSLFAQDGRLWETRQHGIGLVR